MFFKGFSLHYALKTYPVTSSVVFLVVLFYCLTASGLLSSEQLLYFEQLSFTNLVSAPWRLLTPMLLHHTVWHMLINLIIWVEFAHQVEARNHLILLCLVVIIACASHSVEFVLVDNRFGGLSGVVLGLASYVAIRARAEPRAWRFTIGYTIALIGLILAGFVITDFDYARYVHLTAALFGLVAGLLHILILKDGRARNVF